MSRPDKQAERSQAEPCIWVAAGVISYKLCDRSFDCESCPLDTALTRSTNPVSTARTSAAITSWTFPEGRRYSPSHLWLLDIADDRLRVGADALAALLLNVPSGVRCLASGRRLRRGDPACVVQLLGGEIVVGTPVSGRLVRWNDALLDAPELLVSDPYGDGWLFELEPPFDREEQAALSPAAEIPRLARLDVRHFQRRVAMRLLLHGVDRVGPVAADGGVALYDIRQILGAEAFLAVVQQTLELSAR